MTGRELLAQTLSTSADTKFDGWGLIDTDGLFTVAKPRKHVNAMVFGHASLGRRRGRRPSLDQPASLRPDISKGRAPRLGRRHTESRCHENRVTGAGHDAQRTR